MIPLKGECRNEKRRPVSKAPRRLPHTLYKGVSKSSGLEARRNGHCGPDAYYEAQGRMSEPALAQRKAH